MYRLAKGIQGVDKMRASVTLDISQHLFDLTWQQICSADLVKKRFPFCPRSNVLRSCAVQTLVVNTPHKPAKPSDISALMRKNSSWPDPVSVPPRSRLFLSSRNAPQEHQLTQLEFDVLTTLDSFSRILRCARVCRHTFAASLLILKFLFHRDGGWYRHWPLCCKRVDCVQMSIEAECTLSFGQRLVTQLALHATTDGSRAVSRQIASVFGLSVLKLMMCLSRCVIWKGVQPCKGFSPLT